MLLAIILTALISFTMTFAVMPRAITRLKEKGFTGDTFIKSKREADYNG